LQKLFWNQGEGGLSGVDEYDNSRIWREIYPGLKRSGVHQR